MKKRTHTARHMARPMGHVRVQPVNQLVPKVPVNEVLKGGSASHAAATGGQSWLARANA